MTYSSAKNRAVVRKKNLTIAEVVYEGCFNNPKYFSKFFNTEFNLSPSVFQAEKKKQLKEVESD
jgi:transcriptional regulator GlxA family with amidase domain